MPSEECKSKWYEGKWLSTTLTIQTEGFRKRTEDPLSIFSPSPSLEDSGLALRNGFTREIHGTFTPADPNQVCFPKQWLWCLVYVFQQIVNEDDQDAEMALLESMSLKEKKRLLKSLEKKERKRKWRKSSKRSKEHHEKKRRRSKDNTNDSKRRKSRRSKRR